MRPLHRDERRPRPDRRRASACSSPPSPARRSAASTSARPSRCSPSCGERRGARAALGPRPAVGAQAARGGPEPINARAETLLRQAAVRAADRERRSTAASSSPTAGTSGCGPSARSGDADPVPLHGRRRRAVRVRRPVGRAPRRRRADRVGDDPHHRPRTRSARRCTTACRACSPRPRPRPRGSRPRSTPTRRSSCCSRSRTARTARAPANPAVNRAGVEGPELLVVPPRRSRRSCGSPSAGRRPRRRAGRGSARRTARARAAGTRA